MTTTRSLCTPQVEGDNFRDPDDAAEIMTEYTRWFRRCTSVLDIATGWGALLKILTQEGVHCEGVDLYRPSVIALLNEGYRVILNDALGFLRFTRRTWDGIMLSHIIEHFAEPEGWDLLDLAYSHLDPGGVLVVVTPNMNNPGVARKGFRSDPTHVVPYSREDIVAHLVRWGALIVESGDSDIERRRFRDRFARMPLKAAVLWLRLFILSGCNRRFLLGDTYVVAQRTSS